MTDVDSSLVYWNEKQILPKAIFLTSSGSGGDRILFWHPSPHFKSKFNEDDKLNATSFQCGAQNQQSRNADISEPTKSSIKLNHNPFALNLILDRLSHSTDPSSPVISPFNVGFFHSSSDRNIIVGSSSNMNAGLCNAASLNASTMCSTSGGGAGVGGGLGNTCLNTNIQNSTYISSGHHFSNSNILTDHNLSNIVIGNMGILNVEGIQTELLLSLLHQKSHTLQRKIYVKLKNEIFVGAAFNLTPLNVELMGLSNPQEDNVNVDSNRTYKHSIISFAVVFHMDSIALPSILSYLTELARLIGSQIRRAELVFDYLTTQRNIILSTFENISYEDSSMWSHHPLTPLQTPTLTTNSSNTNTTASKHSTCSLPNNVLESNYNSVAPKSISSGQPTADDFMLCELKSNEAVSNDCLSTRCGGLLSPICTTVVSGCLTINIVDSNNNNNSNNNNVVIEDPIKLLKGKESRTKPLNPLERLVQLSSLCSNLKFILNSLCETGHVNVKINGMYPVQFSLPHKTFSISHDLSIYPSVAIRPIAVWRAIDKIRPYHTIILTRRRKELINDYVTTEINPILPDFIQVVSPTVSLHKLAQCFHSLSQCINLAKWLVSRGHALIVYPIVANNFYILAPHSDAWFTPQLISQFARSFPDVNFAEILTSFSSGLTLKDCFQDESRNVDSNYLHSKVNTIADHDSNKTENSKIYLKSWAYLLFEEKINLISWFLRRRLIIQIHSYVSTSFFSLHYLKCEEKPAHLTNMFCENANEHREIVYNPVDAVSSINVSSGNLDNFENKLHEKEVNLLVELDESNWSTEKCVEDVDNQNLKHLSKEMKNTLICDYSYTPQNSDHDYVNKFKDLWVALGPHLQESEQTYILNAIVQHPGALHDQNIFRLFIRLLKHVPAHFEELLFHEGVSRSDLVECIERFSPFLVVTKLPDPVTACFAGIPWSDNC